MMEFLLGLVTGLVVLIIYECIEQIITVRAIKKYINKLVEDAKKSEEAEK